MKFNDEYIALSRVSRKLSIRSNALSELLKSKRIDLPVYSKGKYNYTTLEDYNKWINQEMELFKKRFSLDKINPFSEIICKTELLDFMQMNYSTFNSVNDKVDYPLKPFKSKCNKSKKVFFTKKEVRDWITKYTFEIMTRDGYWHKYLASKPIPSNQLDLNKSNFDHKYTYLWNDTKNKNAIEELIEAITKSDVIKNEIKKILQAGI